MLISSTKEGRKDGSYSRLFGDKNLGALISRVHSATISAGNELEKIIESKAHKLDNIDSFINGKLKKGTYLITKKVLKKSVLKGNQEPDFLVIKVENKYCYIIELKDGDNFDTKKAQGEKNNLVAFKNHIADKINYKVSIHICCFNQEDKDKIRAGMKNKFDLNEIMTGREFCKLLELNYENIINHRKEDQKKNIQFFKNSINELWA